MLSDLDRLMRERAIDTVIVPMHEAMHASFRWLSRGAKLTRGYAVKPRGRAPILITYPMEREEALATGLEVHLAHIHEKPSFSLTQRDVIEEGDILTIEPGLYFPDREIGVRIEDTFVVTSEGVETLCRGSYELTP